MSSDLLASLRGLSDGELVTRVKTLAGHERQATTALVAHLGELEVRDLHFRAGYGSLFAYCRDALALSEHEAYNRIEVARAVRRFPEILNLLSDSSLNLTSVRLLAPHLTADNHREVLASACGKKKADVEVIVARLWPRPDVPASLRKLPPSKAAAATAAALGAAASGAPTPSTTPPASPVLPSALATRSPAPVAALSPDRYKLQVTIGGETLERLRLAKDMLRHAVPSGDDAAILDRALTALLADLARKKFAVTEAPRPSRGTTPGSRHVPAEVRRAVFLRDLGRCAFVGTDGRRCQERGFLEFHHLRPYAVGGEATVENIQLRCRRHNDYEARAFFGLSQPDGGAGWVRESSPAHAPASLRHQRGDSFQNESPGRHCSGARGDASSLGEAQREPP
jgi:hypothetical protein